MKRANLVAVIGFALITAIGIWTVLFPEFKWRSDEDVDVENVVSADESSEQDAKTTIE